MKGDPGSKRQARATPGRFPFVVRKSPHSVSIPRWPGKDHWRDGSALNVPGDLRNTRRH